MNSFHLRLVALAAITAMCQSTAALAQQKLPEVEVRADVDSTEEAHFANELAQRAWQQPVSSTIISGQALRQTAPENLRQVTSLAPNLSAFDTGGERMTNISMRGNREQNYQYGPGLQPAVAYYVDDVPSLNALARASMLPSLSSVSVVRGPQGFTHGAALAGGLIELTTLSGQAQRHAMLEVGAGNHGQRYATMALRGAAGPADVFRYSIDAQTDQRHGYYDNVANGSHYGDKKGHSLRGKLGLRPQGGNFEADLILEAQRFRDQPDPFLNNIEASPSRQVNVFYNGKEKTDNDLVALRLKWHLQEHELLSVTSWRQTQWSFSNDSGVYPMPELVQLEGYTHDKEKAFTQEVRLTRPVQDSAIGYTVGAFYADRSLDVQAGMRILPGIEIPGMPLRESHSTLRDFALYGESTIALSPQWQAGFGLRYAVNERKAHNNFGSPFINSGDKRFQSWMPRVTLRYQPSENWNWFASYSKGLRPGDLNSDASVTQESLYVIQPQKSDHFELGFKSRNALSGLELNGSLYWSNYRHYHNFTSYPFAQGLRTIGVTVADKARAWGGELEAGYDIHADWKVFGSLGFTNATFRRFELGDKNYSGNRISFIPRMTGALGVAWEKGPYFVRAELQQTGRYYFDEGNMNAQRGFSLVNLSARWQFSEHVSAGVAVRNLFDKRYVSYAYDQGSKGVALGGYGAPRTVSVNLRFEL